MTMEINGGEFYFATVNGVQTVHDDKADAIGAVGDEIDSVEAGDADISHVDTTGDGWQITGLPPREIYLALLQEGDE